MRFNTTFSESDQTFTPTFNSVVNLSDEERGRAYDEGYNAGYGEGNSQGYTEGYSNGYEVGGLEGYHAGRDEGRVEGYAQGKIDGFEEGKIEGYAEGKGDGITEGIEQGREEGLIQGRDEGFSWGKEEGLSEGIEQGKQAAYDAFWDAYQRYGNRGSYTCAFAGGGWTEETFIPKYDMNVTDGYMMFRGHGLPHKLYDLAEHLEKLGVSLNVTGSNQYMFYNAFLSRVPSINSKGSVLLQTFYSNTHIVTIDEIIVDEQTTYNDAFRACTALENLKISGTIAKNGFNVQWSTKLTHDSLMSIINALDDKSTDVSGTTWTITLGSTNIAKLTEDEQRIVEQKGWYLK